MINTTFRGSFNYYKPYTRSCNQWPGFWVTYGSCNIQASKGFQGIGRPWIQEKISVSIELLIFSNHHRLQYVERVWLILLSAYAILIFHHRKGYTYKVLAEFSGTKLTLRTNNSWVGVYISQIPYVHMSHVICRKWCKLGRRVAYYLRTAGSYGSL